MPVETEQQFNILLVDDDKATLMGLEAALAELGQNLVSVGTGKEALHAVLQKDFAVILLDVRMPGLDGFETAALIRQREKSAHIPIIFITASDKSENHVARGYSLGAVDYIYAPAMPEILRAKVRALLEPRRYAERVRREERCRHQQTLARTREALEAEIKRFFTLSLDLLCVIGFDGSFQQLNPSGEQILGLTAERLNGLGFLDFVHEEDRAATQAEMQKLRAGAPRISFENRYRVQDGSYRILLWNAAPYPQDELIYAAGRDVTERRLELKRQVEREALLTANRELEAFSYSVSHDLRAPLRALDGFSQILLEDYGPRLDEQGRHYLQRIRQGAQHMGELIQSLLQLSRVTRCQLNVVPVDVSALLHSIAADFRERAPGRRVQVVIPKGITATADPPLLRALLLALFDNAWKYTSKKESAQIVFGSEHQGEEQVYVMRDNGAGFDMAYAGRLFTAFQRLHPADEFPGCGIGLATAQRVVQRHGGRLWADAAVDRGAAFYFTLGSRA